MMSLLSEASPFALFVVCMMMLIGGLVCGLIADVILRDTGFGVPVNGILVLVGTVLGVWARLAF